MNTPKENIRVAIRFRPQNRRESEMENEEYVFSLDEKTVTLGKKSENKSYGGGGGETHTFSFDHVFDEKTSQIEIFEKIAKKSVEWVVEGYNATIFAYGPTGSGKTYCMFGSPEDQGIIPRVCEMLFSLVNTKSEVQEANVKCSFLEIYRENIRDLLRGTDVNGMTANLKLRYSEIRGAYVQDLSEKSVCNAEEILEIIKDGAKQRSTAPTSLNSVSSRSHAVLTLLLTQKITDGTEIISKLNLVDLAGSENVGKSEVVGTSLLEAQQINKSLSSLGNVINALAEKGREHVPYRDSKLTHLLQDSLGGNSRTILIITASSHFSSYSETLNTLKFGKRAKDIKNAPRVNRNDGTVNLSKKIEEMAKIIEDLRAKYEDALSVIENGAGDSKIAETMRLSVTRVENKNLFYREELEKKKLDEEKFWNFFEKQRELAQKISEELCEERLKNAKMCSKIEKYELCLKILGENENIHAFPMIIKNFGEIFE